MPRLPAIRRRYRIAAAVAAAILLFLWLLPIGLRLGAEHWLESRGYTAAIDNIDLNLFTGRLAIDGARAEDAAGDGFRIGHAAVDLHYLPLFDRHLHLAGLTLHDAALDLRRDGGLRVAGFALVPGTDEAPSQDAAGPAQPWGFGLDSADVDGLALRYHEPGFSREITLATSTASDVATWTPGNPFPLDADLRLGDARVAVEGRLRPFGDRVAGELSLRVEKLTLQAFAPFVEGRGNVERLAGTVGADLDIAIDYAGDTGLGLDVTGQAGLAGGEIELAEIATIAAGIDWQGEIEARLLHPDSGSRIDTDGRLSLSNANASLATAPYDIAAGELTWEGRAGLLPGADAVPADAQPPLRVAGTLGGKNLRVDDRNLGRRLLRAADLTVEGIDLAGPKSLAVARIAAADIKALARTAGAPSRDDYPRTLDLAALEATDLTLNGGDHLAIERLSLDTPRGIVVRSAEGGIELTEWLPAGGEETGDEDSLRVAVNEIAVTGDGQLRFEDRGVEPTAVLDFNKPQLTLRNLDTGAPAQASPLTFVTGVGRYGRIEIEGDIRPLADPLSLDLTGRARALNLTPASGYIRQALERRIEQGILDAELDLAVDAGAIDGLAELNLRKFRLGGVVGDSGAVERSLGLPLDRALSLLRDEDGSIGIDLPLGGDLQNPQFSLNSVVRQAVLEGVQVAILSYYSPLGVIKVANTLVDLATALRFEPVPFEAGSAELGGDARAYLDRMAGLLAERPQARFVVCGRAVPADREALAPDDGEPAAAEDLRQRLLALAERRTYAVTGYLVDAGIDGQRLVPCNPSVDNTEGAAPRTTISL